MLSARSLREVNHITLYNEEMGFASHFDPKSLLHNGRKIHLNSTEEFWNHMKKSQGLESCRISPVHHFTVFEMTRKALIPGHYEWEKMRLIPKANRLISLWEVFLIFQAHRMGYVDVLLSKDDAANTFYVQDGLVGLAIDIERDCNTDKPDEWWIHARGIGDDHYMPHIQRIFVGN